MTIAGLACGGGCPEPWPIQEGVYSIIESPMATEVVGGTMTIDGDEVIIEYTDESGDLVRVRYLDT